MLFLLSFLPNTFFKFIRFIKFVTTFRGYRIQSKFVWRSSAGLNVGGVSIKVKWRNAKTGNFFFFFLKKKCAKTKDFHSTCSLLKWLFDTHERKHLILFRKKKAMSFCGHNFTFECWKCWLFLRQDCGKGKPWNHFRDTAIKSMGQKQFRALCEKWQYLH